MENRQNSISWFEYFRVITPIIVTISLFMITMIWGKINEVDEKMFKHLTNDEMHAARSQTLSKNEFSMHCQMQERDRTEVMAALLRIEKAIEDGK